MVMVAQNDQAAPGTDVADIVLQILHFEPEIELERYTIELRSALQKRFGPYSDWPQHLRRSLEQSEFPNVLLFLGDLFSLDDDHEKAAKFYSRAIDTAKVAAALKTMALATIRLATALGAC
jgi:hypothetical protein